VGFALKLSPMFRARRSLERGFGDARGGGAAVEFALLGPILLLLLSGIFTYGGYFLTAHTVQQITNDAARASLAGLDDAERASLARDAAMGGLRGQAFMRGELTQIDVAREGAALSIAVTYDASNDLYWAFLTLLPMPSPAISRSATIRLGGF
jgi:Flp pilus assembly protein TadG